jgi:hypothetical protein
MLYDLSELRLFSRGDATFELDMIETFLEEAADYGRIMREGYAAGDYAIVGATAHRFKSSVNVFGMKPLHVILNDMELASKTGHDESLMARLMQQFEDMLGPLTRMMLSEKAKYQN